MIRVIAVVACGVTLAACTSWMPSFEMPSFRSGPAMTMLSIESDPPGAEAKLSTGADCRTPCALSVPVTEDFTVSLALNGYQPQSVPVRAVQADARLDPNPLYVELQPVPPPAVKKRPTSKRPRTAAKPAPKPAPAAPAPAPPAGQLQPAPAAPWPAPR